MEIVFELKTYRFPHHTTPLYAAANANSMIVKFLLLRKGVLYHKKSRYAEGDETLKLAVKEKIIKAKNEIINSSLVLMASSVYDSLFGMLIREINKLIVLKSFVCGSK